jgi:hypothetical protein
VWWRRWHAGGDEQLDNAHLMRLAGRFARRVRAFAQAHGIPVIDCKAGERKHQIAEECLAEHPETGVGVFMILVARSQALVWKADRSATGVLCNLEKTRQFISHYSFQILDPSWGHVTIKISGRPPFSAQVILNGHEYVAAAARSAGIGFAKEGNCFTHAGGLRAPGSDRRRLVPARDDRATEPTDRPLDLHGVPVLRAAQRRAEAERLPLPVLDLPCRNLVFASGARMERLFNTIVDRTRSRPDLPTLRTMFPSKVRPYRKPGHELSLQQAVVIEKPRYDLTIFKVHFGHLTLKAYTKGEHVLRFEAIAHHTNSSAADARWTRSRRSSGGWPGWSSASPACSTASTSAFCPTDSSTSSRPSHRSAQPASAGLI